MTRVLVTGGAGFIGGWIARGCASRGFEVRVLDVSPPSANLGEFEQGSVADRAAVDRALRGVDYVFHEAAITSPLECDGEPERAVQVNIGGTLNVLDAALKQGVKRVVLASSSAVYGTSNAVGVELPHPPQVSEIYGMTKIAAETLARCYSDRGVPVIAMRYYNTYGVGEMDKKVGRSVVSNLIADVVEGRAPVLYGDGQQARDFVYVEDVVAANLRALEHGTPGEVYNVGTGVATSFRDILRTVEKEFGVETQPVFPPFPHKTYQLFTQADTRKAARELGFRASVSLAEGVHRIALSLQRSDALRAPAPAGRFATVRS